VIKLIINQLEHSISGIDPNTTLLEYLREHLHRSGTKDGCATGDCGACTVVVGQASGNEIQYQAINACTILVGSLHGKQLLTIEDIQSEDELHPVQQAIVDRHGSQCGFCTPGIVMALFAYRKTHQGPERKSIVSALEGNLCRCTGYRPIIEAAGNMFADSGVDEFSRAEAATAEKLNRINQDTATVELSAGGNSYFAPTSLQALSGLVLQYPQARLVAGGTDLSLKISQTWQEFEVLISVGRVKEMLTISSNDEFLEIGAAVTYSKARNALIALHTELGELIDRLGSLQIRNTGTLAGNLATASATGDMATALIALEASLRLRRGGETRKILAEDLYTGNKSTVLRPSEFIERIIIPLPGPKELFRAYKISKRFGVDISTTCGVFKLQLENEVIKSAIVAFAGMAETPKRAHHCEHALLGKELCESSIELAMQSLCQDFAPISDARASAAYRLEVSKNLLRRLYLETRPGYNPVRLNHFA
jgi:xanthine dehydrogenase small subunit